MAITIFRWRLLLVLFLFGLSTLCGIAVADQDAETCLADGTCESASTDRSEERITSNADNDGAQIGIAGLECVDADESCEYWASIGECAINPAYMHLKCMKSCKLCSEDK